MSRPNSGSSRPPQGTITAAQAAGATVRTDVVSVPIGGTPIKIAMIVDPDGNVVELMELPQELDHLPH